MSRYIDADAFEEVLKKLNKRGIYPTTRDERITQNYLDEFPTADVVEVVRCEDCKYWDNHFDVMVCNLTDGMKGASDYCSFGERRKDDTQN